MTADASSSTTYLGSDGSEPGTVWPPAGERPPVSVVILTFNEEINIAACIRSCAWCDDVHVLDSGSTDRTRQIAEEMGAKVHVNPFTSFGDQRNWAIDHIPCKHPWHFHLDADERFTPALVAEMRRRLGADGSLPTESAYLCPNKMMLMGRWLKWSGGYPAYQMRLFRYGRCRFVDFGHGQREQCDDPIGTLDEPYYHYNFSKGLLEWFYKHNHYSTREAEEAMQVRSRGRPTLGQLLGRSTVGEGMTKRRAWKNLSYFLKGRPLWRFIYNYIARRGFLDGRAGLRYCAMISVYEYWTELKIRERAHPWGEKISRTVERMTGPMIAPGSSALRAERGQTDSAPLAPGSESRATRNTGRVDVLIPTLNEAPVIGETVTNALQVGPVFVLDSCSTDGTQEIARAAGATVVEHAFEGYARQKNWGLDHLPMTGEWVFILDADERFTPELRDEVLRTAADPASADGYFANRVVVFMGRPIRHGGLYPSWNLRLFRHDKCRYEDRSVHEHMVCDGPTTYLKHEMVHIRSESVQEWIRKHIRYADLESDEWVKLKFGQEAGAEPGRLFRSAMRYRQWLRREVWPRTPLKPVLRFFYMYFGRLGFLDGLPGAHMAVMMAAYEYMIDLLYKDKLDRIKRGIDPPPLPAPPPPRPQPPPPPPAAARTERNPQAAGYEAIFRGFHDKPWLQGMFWWKVGTNGIGRESRDNAHAPWGKPAMDVLKNWYLRL